MLLIFILMASGFVSPHVFNASNNNWIAIYISGELKNFW